MACLERGAPEGSRPSIGSLQAPLWQWEAGPFVRLRREGNVRRESVAVAFVQIAAEGVRAAERSAVAGADAGVSPTILDAAALALGCVGEREIGLCCFASREHAECRASDPRGGAYALTSGERSLPPYLIDMYRA